MRRAPAIGLLLCAAAAPGAAEARTWHVRAQAGLQEAQERSRAGDRIVVHPASEPLAGPIELKPRQRLIGRPGATVTSAAGDAVVLADRTRVKGLTIAGAARGGIYGHNVDGVVIERNDVSGHNTSCARGFHIPPFNVPTTLPGVGIPISEGLHNGWAGIMVDADRGRARLTLRRNTVHHAECGDGIDVRASGTARVRAVITRNVVHDLRQGEALESVLAFGLQTRDRARLTARLDRNRQHALGNDEDVGPGPSGADSEGVFVNPVGPSTMRVVVSRNRYAHTPGRGGFSANGLEFVSMGDGSDGRVTVRDSVFEGTPGDVLEQLALGTNARLRLTLDDVVARDSGGFGNTVVIPGNNGDCLLAASGGAGNAVHTVVRDSALTGCANNGLTFGSAVANGSGATKRMRLAVVASTITGNRGNNLRVGNVSALDDLQVAIERSDLTGAGATAAMPADASFENLGTTTAAAIDLGGGALGSAGGNCLGSAALVRYDVSARRAWWGGPVRALTVGGALEAGEALAERPACGRAARP
jgi:hypothetical protein